MRLALSAVALLLVAAAPPPSDPVPPALQDVIIAKISTTLVLPASAIWQFDRSQPYALGGTLVCGRVNYQISTRRYVGMSPFYAVVNDGKVSEWALVSTEYKLDPTGATTLAYKQHCDSGA